MQHNMDFYLAVNKRTTYLPQTLDMAGTEVAVVDCFLLPELVVQAAKLHVTIVSFEGDQPSAQEKTVDVMPNDGSAFWLITQLQKKLEGQVRVNIEDSGHITITPKPKIGVILSTSLSSLLGFPKGAMTEKTTSSERPIGVELLAQRIIISTNLVQAYQINGSYIPGLYQGSPVSNPSPLIYHDVVPFFVHFVNLKFHNIFGEELNVSDKRFTVVLKFRPKKTLKRVL